MTVWLNGVLVAEAEARVSAFDHGLTVGDGVFETMKVVEGTPFALTRHLARLGHSARGLGLPVPADDVLRSAVADVIAASPVAAHAAHRLRITLTGGPGPQGTDRGTSGSTLLVALAPARPWPLTAKIVVVPWTRNEQAATVGLKTTSYADNVVALAHAKAVGGSEAVFANSVGMLCEGTGSNVFVVLGGAVLTPPLSSGALGGVTRALVLKWSGAEELDLPISVLDAASEIFLTSSTRDVQGVHAVGDRALVVAPGSVTVEIAATFAARAGADLDP